MFYCYVNSINKSIDMSLPSHSGLCCMYMCVVYLIHGGMWNYANLLVVAHCCESIPVFVYNSTWRLDVFYCIESICIHNNGGNTTYHVHLHHTLVNQLLSVHAYCISSSCNFLGTVFNVYAAQVRTYIKLESVMCFHALYQSTKIYCCYHTWCLVYTPAQYYWSNHMSYVNYSVAFMPHMWRPLLQQHQTEWQLTSY